MNLSELRRYIQTLRPSPTMPVLFIGHGSPTNAIEDNEFTQGWKNAISALEKPQVILCISAHWETRGTYVTAMEQPKTIHDFGGFPPEMYEINYPTPGHPEVAQEVKDLIQTTNVGLDQTWGLDHGCWVPIMKMYPNADIPVLQMSIDYTKGAQYHYDLAKELQALRNKGVLIVGSGNMVHNLGMFSIQSFDELNKEFGFDWALEMNEIFKQKINSRDHNALINYETLSASAKLAIPTTDHYFPLLYALALQGSTDETSYFNDKAIAGSITMTSVIIGKI